MTVTDNSEAGQYELRVNDELAGIASYSRRGNIIELPHTKVEPRFEGRGFGSALIADVLERARAAGDQVVPQCPFVAAYIRRHPEYADLVSEDRRGLIAR
ncbi:MAG TPA: GNAT family N-acetyltransferase [Mycobacteriales bacterium]|jgi:predicted GNAT family acetyltransferase|nr:GNAT family N-acetyltransferase [Mycobacteriales bacterium]